MIKILLKYIIPIVLISLAFAYGGGISFAMQWPLYEALRTTASIIIAIMAAWIAIIYPEKLRLLTNKNNSKKTEGQFSNFLNPIVNSLAILCIVLIIGIVAPIFSQIEIIKIYHYFFLRISYTFLVFLTLWQIYSVVMVFLPMHLIKQASDSQEQVQTDIINDQKLYKEQLKIFNNEK